MLLHLRCDALALIQFPAGLGALQQSFGRGEIPGFHERLCLVLRADVVCRSHFFHLESFGDDSQGIGPWRSASNVLTLISELSFVFI